MKKFSNTSECLEELFRNTHSVDDLMGHFIHLSVLLREISMNAAIASGHAEEKAKIFNEIAKKIGEISSLLQQVAKRIQGLTAQISTHILKSIVNSTQREKFFKSISLIKEEKNHATLQFIIKNYAVTISEQLYHAQLLLSHLKPEQDGLKQMVNRISSIVISLRVLANTAEHGEDSFLNAIAQSLEEVSNQANSYRSNLFTLINLIDASLSEKCLCIKGDLHAA